MPVSARVCPGPLVPGLVFVSRLFISQLCRAACRLDLARGPRGHSCFFRCEDVDYMLVRSRVALAVQMASHDPRGPGCVLRAVFVQPLAAVGLVSAD